MFGSESSSSCQWTCSLPGAFACFIASKRTRRRRFSVRSMVSSSLLWMAANNLQVHGIAIIESATAEADGGKVSEEFVRNRRAKQAIGLCNTIMRGCFWLHTACM